MEIRMEPWGSLEGTLMQAGKPVINETLSVTLGAGFRPKEPMLNLQHRTVTDSAGQFKFDHLPPGKLQIVTLISMDSGGLAHGWTHQPQKDRDYSARRAGARGDRETVGKLLPGR